MKTKIDFLSDTMVRVRHLPEASALLLNVMGNDPRSLVFKGEAIRETF
jgi:hypothetical protein